MSEEERYLYREFEREDNDKIAIQIYKRMYDAVSLMALNYEKQIAALPGGINIPDEIALVFDDEVMAVMKDLYEKQMLSLDECELITVIGNKLSEMVERRDISPWTLDGLKNETLWEECRVKAKLLLLKLYKLE